MSVITAFDTVPDSDLASVPASSPAEGRPLGRLGPVTLRKSGARPISFNGMLLGQCSGQRAGLASWHELGLYQTDDGRFVANVHVCFKPKTGADQFYVCVGETLDEAVSFFETFDPRKDVVADFDLMDPNLVPAEVVVHGAALRYRVSEVAAQYRSALGEFLRQLNGA